MTLSPVPSEQGRWEPGVSVIAKKLEDIFKKGVKGRSLAIEKL